MLQPTLAAVELRGQEHGEIVELYAISFCYGICRVALSVARHGSAIYEERVRGQGKSAFSSGSLCLNKNVFSYYDRLNDLLIE